MNRMLNSTTYNPQIKDNQPTHWLVLLCFEKTKVDFVKKKKKKPNFL